MSKIGRKIIQIPQGATCSFKNGLFVVKGPKGTLERVIPAGVDLEMEAETIKVVIKEDTLKNRALYGTIRQVVSNMIQGVTEGFVQKLEIVGIGYKAAIVGSELVLNVGYSHPVKMKKEEDIEFTVSEPTKITISGINKEKVGQMAALIRSVRAPEPYKGKGIKYAGEVIKRKEGKKS